MIKTLLSYFWAVSLIGPLFLLPRNWDGYGADKGKLKALIASIVFLAKVKAVSNVTKPEAYIARDGSVELIWDKDFAYLALNIIDSGLITYVWTDNTNEACGSGKLRKQAISELLLTLAETK